MANVSNRMTTDEYRALQKVASKRKYRNIPNVWQGKWKGKTVSIKFDSEGEMRWGVGLIRKENAGLIKNLEFQKKFELVPKTKDERSLSYIADGAYYDPLIKQSLLKKINVVADYKGYPTPMYIAKRKMFKYQNPDILFIEIKES